MKKLLDREPTEEMIRTALSACKFEGDVDAVMVSAMCKFAMALFDAAPELTVDMELKYPKSKTTIDDMCKILKFFGIEAKEYTDCTIMYEVTFDQLRTLYNSGKDHEQVKAGITVDMEPVAWINDNGFWHRACGKGAKPVYSATQLATLQAENERLRKENEELKAYRAGDLKAYRESDVSHMIDIILSNCLYSELDLVSRVFEAFSRCGYEVQQHQWDELSKKKAHHSDNLKRCKDNNWCPDCGGSCIAKHEGEKHAG